MDDDGRPLADHGITVLSQREQTVPDDDGGYYQAIVIRFKGQGWGPVTAAIPTGSYNAAVARAAILERASELGAV